MNVKNEETIFSLYFSLFSLTSGLYDIEKILEKGCQEKFFETAT